MPHSSQPLSESLIGTWELVSRVDFTSIGERRIDPALGADPIALLIYDRNGHFAAQFMRRDRDHAADDDAAPAMLNNSRSQGGYDAYFGHYTIDDSQSTVTQTLVGALSAENVGQVLTRHMTVVGDELTIQIEMTAADADVITRTLRWKRVG